MNRGLQIELRPTPKSLRRRVYENPLIPMSIALLGLLWAPRTPTERLILTALYSLGLAYGLLLAVLDK